MSSLAYTVRVSMAHLTSTDREAVARFSADVRRQFPGRVESIQVFGSKARGEATEDSDVDVLVVITEGDWRDKKEISRLASQVFGGTGVLLSPVVCTVKQVGRMRQQRHMFWQSVEPDLLSV